MWRNVLFLPPAIWHQAGFDTDSEQLLSDTSSKYIHIIGPDQQESYGVALWVAHQRALDTTKALQNDLKRLSREQRERSPTHPHG